MKNRNKINKVNLHCLWPQLLLMASLMSSCQRYLEVNPPVDKISTELVFSNDDAAKSALDGIYSVMLQTGFASGNLFSVTSLAGLSADEFTGFDLSVDPYYRNALTPSEVGLWQDIYRLIYAVNAILEGIEKSNKISLMVKNQLEGEAKFVRAFCYFYLVNLFGNVPLQLTTDYKKNNQASRTPQAEVYSQIVQDLSAARELLLSNYYANERVRPNKWAATALLARVYLYSKDWANAEQFSDNVINNSDLYALNSDLNHVFLKNSTEAIWQLLPDFTGMNTAEAQLFIFVGLPTKISLTASLIDAIGLGDKRLSHWTSSSTFSGKRYYYPYKYKVGAVSTISEYSMVLRLAEQYLIRAEARINLGKIDLGLQDLNKLRERARSEATVFNPNPLPALTALNKSLALLAVEKERRSELFSEWGHRWLDLKRTNRADVVLSGEKGPGWQVTDIWYPIPQTEINANSKITQNEGY